MAMPTRKTKPVDSSDSSDNDSADHNYGTVPKRAKCDELVYGSDGDNDDDSAAAETEVNFDPETKNLTVDGKPQLFLGKGQFHYAYEPPPNSTYFKGNVVLRVRPNVLVKDVDNPSLTRIEQSRTWKERDQQNITNARGGPGNALMPPTCSDYFDITPAGFSAMIVSKAETPPKNVDLRTIQEFSTRLAAAISSKDTPVAVVDLTAKNIGLVDSKLYITDVEAIITLPPKIDGVEWRRTVLTMPAWRTTFTATLNPVRIPDKANSGPLAYLSAPHGAECCVQNYDDLLQLTRYWTLSCAAVVLWQISEIDRGCSDIAQSLAKDMTYNKLNRSKEMSTRIGKLVNFAGVFADQFVSEWRASRDSVFGWLSEKYRESFTDTCVQ